MKTAERLNQIADLKDLVMELDLIMRGSRAVICNEPRILRSLEEARSAAKTKYEDMEKQCLNRAG